MVLEIRDQRLPTSAKRLISLGSPLNSLMRPFHPRRVEAAQQCSKTIQARKEPSNIKAF
jgi:hypothetical protein